MSQLDFQQQQAVETESWRAMVIAGAGSGKTRVLTERIAHLIENCKVSPSEILAMTFTRKAAGEMQSRLEERIGNSAFGLCLGTMHALALRMINRFGEVIGLKSRKVTIYSEWEEAYLLRDVALEMGLYDGKKWKGMKAGDVMSVLGGYYQRGVEPEDSDPVHDIFRAFIQRCRENNAMTYGGLMVGLRLLIPTMAKYLNIKHILVDEVQDIDHLQWDIILEMEKQFGAALFVVGDVDQSIYEWRGAAPEYLVNHRTEFDIISLEQNYRSLPDIVDAANRLIEHNAMRLPLMMKATRVCNAKAV
ncbi:MAG: ATP-dependent helicase [Pseudomonadota bacterium]